MKLTVLAGILAGTLSLGWVGTAINTVSAEEAPTPPHRSLSPFPSTELAARPRNNTLERFASRLELSVEQRQDIEALLTSHREWLQTNLRDADGNLLPDAQERAARATEALHDEIRLRLTLEQTAQYDQMQQATEQRRAAMQQRRMHRAPRGFAALDLSDEQTSAIRELMREHHQQLHTNRPAHDGGGMRDRTAWREMAESRRALMDNIRDILTEEQIQHLREQHRRDGRGTFRRRHGDTGGSG